MASPPPFQVEDQTDEDFFDRLVDDDLSLPSSRLEEASEMVRALSDMSIGDVGLSSEDSGDNGFANGEENQQKDGIFESSDDPGVESLGVEKVDELKLTSEDSEEKTMAEVVSPGSSVGRESGSKGTSVRVVQWSSFGGSEQHFGSDDGFGSNSDFLTDNVGDELKNGFGENPIPNLSFGVSSSEQQNAQFFGLSNVQRTGVNDAQFYGSAIAQTTEAEFYGSAHERTANVNNPQFYGSAIQHNTDARVYGSVFEQITDMNDSQFYGSAVEKTADAQPYGSTVEQTMNARSYGSTNEQTVGNGVHFYGSATERTTDVNDGQTYGSANGKTTGVSDAQFYAANVNDAHYWENRYPGWKFDSSNGQWYQIDSYNTTTNVQSDNYNMATANEQEDYQEKVQAAEDGLVVQQSSEVSYLQYTAKSVIGTVSEDYTTGAVSNWNQASQGNTEYPPNMVFDPQYPEWYYDTNTQQWCMLESFHQTVQQTAAEVGDQLNQVNAADDIISKNSSFYSEAGHAEDSNIQGQGNQGMGKDWNGYVSKHVQQNILKPDTADKSLMTFSGNQQMGNFYGSVEHAVNHTDQHLGFTASVPIQNGDYNNNGSMSGIRGFVPSESLYQFSQPKVEQTWQADTPQSFYTDQNLVNFSQQQFHGTNSSSPQFSFGFNEGRSSAGRPPHALVTFGFGGKIIVMKKGSSFGTGYDSQDTVGGTVSILSLMEIMMDKSDASSIISSDDGYFHTLCQQHFPGPLVGGNAAAKDVNKWIDEKAAHCESSYANARKGESLRLLLSLLKISVQHYGKLRSPYSASPSLEEVDGPESAVTKLFASSRANGVHPRDYASCMQNLPSEGQILATVVEVQNHLVSGRRKEALQCAQAGQLWGPALVLAAQLGEEYYVDTVKQMANRQFLSGSPLRTLCLLIAGQREHVFSADCSYNSSLSGALDAPEMRDKILANSLLDKWEENLAIVIANRTKDDHVVITHVADCLWKLRGEISAAHACYLVAEANFESYSNGAKLCLIGADHLKFPRTYASPEAIQRTEIYEYAKVLGNSQFVLPHFQPYKLLYAYMLAEVGKVSDSLRYCQASLKLLKNSTRTPEVEMWKSLLSSLEERLRTHQQGGYGTNLAPAKLVGKFFTSIDRSIHKIMGAPPAPLPPLPPSSVNSKESYMVVPKVMNIQSTMDMSSLIPSASVEGIGEGTSDSTKNSMHSRSISEPDFGSSPKQEAMKDANSADVQSKVPQSRFSRIGSQLFQKTIGWVSRPHRQAKLGESNKFYYDEKLKRWVEEGAEPPAEEVALPPPPTTTSFQNGSPDYRISNAFKTQNLTSNGGPETKSPISSEHSSGMPPISPSPNQFSARGRMGVRSRYVDTFNKGGGGGGSGALLKSFQSPTTPSPSVNPASGVKFFVPTVPAASNEQADDATTAEGIHEAAVDGSTSTSAVSEASFSLPPPPPSEAAVMHRFSSMNNISPMSATLPNGSNSSFSSLPRAASWSGGGSFRDTGNPNMAEVKHQGFTSPPPFQPALHQSSSPLQLMGGSSGDDLHEVEL